MLKSFENLHYTFSWYIMQCKFINYGFKKKITSIRINLFSMSIYLLRYTLIRAKKVLYYYIINTSVQYTSYNIPQL